jgi:serine/threonine protein kinase
MMETQKVLEGQLVDDRFPLVELLGATPNSSVFRTEHRDAPGNQAAIKLIPAPAATAGAYLTRWRIAARFSHHALLRIFDMGRCDFEGRPTLYVVTELAEENLADILPVRCLSPGEVDAMLGPALEALAYLHAKGFVHGHLQPSNILAIGDQVKLSSDSIARIGELAAAHDARDHYRAPESNLSAASDVWSLGVTLIQCLTGHLPERHPEARNSVSVPAEVPVPFSDLARHCLNPVPQRRWSIAQIQSALGRGNASVAPAAPAESAVPIEAAKVSAPPLASAFAKPAAAAPARRRFQLKKQHRLPLAIAAAAIAAFVLGIAISGSSSDTNVTASAPVAASAKSSSSKRRPKSWQAVPANPNATPLRRR